MHGSGVLQKSAYIDHYKYEKIDGTNILKKRVLNFYSNGVTIRLVPNLGERQPVESSECFERGKGV